MPIVMRYRKTGEEWQEREYPDDRLQELMDRANAVFGDPSKILGGPSESTATVSESGSPPIPRRRRKK